MKRLRGNNLLAGRHPTDPERNLSRLDFLRSALGALAGTCTRFESRQELVTNSLSRRSGRAGKSTAMLVNRLLDPVDYPDETCLPTD